MPLPQKSLEQLSEEDLAALSQHSSAKRRNVNSRGCQPTEQRRKTCSTRKGSHNELFGPFRAGSNSTGFRGLHPRLFTLFASGETAYTTFFARMELARIVPLATLTCNHVHVHPNLLPRRLRDQGPRSC